MQWPEELMFMKNSRAVQKRSTLRLDGKIVVITGTTSGVGKAAAIRFAQGGAHLVMICRNAAKARTLQDDLIRNYQVPVNVLIADFTDLESIRAVARAIAAQYQRIDVLIHNVGIHRTHKVILAEGYDEVFLVNHLAPFLLNCLLLPTMVRSPKSRILYVNSEGHRFSTVHPDDLQWKCHRYTGLKGYGAAKTAQLLTIWEFDEMLKPYEVRITAMHPGAVKSSVGHDNGGFYAWYAQHVLSHFLGDPSCSGEALYYLATTKEQTVSSARFYNQTVEEKPAAHALDRTLGKVVFAQSLQLVGLGVLELDGRKQHEDTV
ncbi:MAG: SDR family NAD(P)-dependent oxidoreductase [Sphaerochaeta sp.]|uniref:SDR family NAD(P)-dependent oxidoreductase n=1 Tax=Sphaerochaeta sp. TaxID=1972642 RepID=UPI003D13ED42